MVPRRLVATATLAAFLAAVAAPASAQTTQASPLRTSIDRAAQSAQPGLPQRKPAPVRKAATQGGGGGGGLMDITLIGTLAGVATTYFLIKEMKKQNDTVTNPAP